ncbi:MAG: hypothetical protein R8P61_14260 [Bacteroidia bacterium]|nr:hypothetical protein [Bacteroidia bacterium]
MDFDSQYDLIESYLDGEMTKVEKADFESRLLTEEGLQKGLDEMKHAKDFLEEGAGLFLKEKMQSFDLEKKEKIKPLFSWRILSVAAVILLLIASFFWFKGPLSGPEAVSENFEPYAATSLRGNAKMENLFNQAVLAYERKDYNNAILFFSQLNADAPNYIESQLYLGNALLAIKDYSSAIAPLEIVSTSKDIRYAEAGDWYLLLAYLGNGQEEDFQQLAGQIETLSTHGYKERINELRAQMK